MNSRKSGAEYFREWFLGLERVHFECIPLEPLVALGQTGFIRGEDSPSIETGFTHAWKRRLGFQENLPKHVEHQGWYLVYAATAIFAVLRMKEGAEQAKFQSHVDLADSLLSRIYACYGTRGFRRQCINDTTLVLIRCEVRGDCRYHLITDVCLPYIGGPLRISKGGSDFYFADPTDRFYFTIGSPQTVEFQRASIIFFDFPSGPINLEPQDFPVLMSWIFAGGYQNALNTAEDALSHRNRVSYSEGRRVLRMALGNGRAPASERL